MDVLSWIRNAHDGEGGARWCHAYLLMHADNHADKSANNAKKIHFSLFPGFYGGTTNRRCRRLGILGLLHKVNKNHDWAISSEIKLRSLRASSACPGTFLYDGQAAKTRYVQGKKKNGIDIRICYVHTYPVISVACLSG